MQSSEADKTVKREILFFTSLSLLPPGASPRGGLGWTPPPLLREVVPEIDTNPMFLLGEVRGV